MAKAVRKIEQLQLPPAPPVDVFLTNLRKLKEKPEPTSTVYHEDQTLMSEFFDDEELEGYSVSFDCAWKCLLYFLEVIDTLDYKFATVDDFFLSWAGCVLSVHALKEKEEDKVPIIEYRKQLGAALQTEGRKIKTYDLAPKSFVNYVNAVMNIYNSKCCAKFYPNSKFTLPRYFRFGSEAVRRYRFWWLATHAQEEEKDPITEEDLLKLHKATNFSCFHEAQIFRFIVVSNRSGAQAITSCFLTETAIGPLQRLEAGTCKPSVSEIKQHMPDLSTADEAFFTQTHVAGPDPRICMFQAFIGQMYDIQGVPAEYPFLWRETDPATGYPSAKPLKPDNIRRQCIRFARKILGKNLTFKDLGRRAYITRGCESKSINSSDLAKVLSVREDTLPRYLKVLENKKTHIARVMAGWCEDEADATWRQPPSFAPPPVPVESNFPAAVVASAAHLPPVQTVGQYHDWVQPPSFAPPPVPQWTFPTMSFPLLYESPPAALQLPNYFPGANATSSSFPTPSLPPLNCALEPMRPDPVSFEPVSVKPGPVRADPVRAEPVQAQPVRAGPTKAESLRVEPDRMEPVIAEPVRVEPDRIKPIRAEYVRPEPVRVEPDRIKPVRAESVRPEPVRVEPDSIAPVRVESVRPEPVRVEPDKSRL